MKILLVSRHVPYILEQVGRFVSDQRDALNDLDGLEVIVFPIKGKGVLSYFKFIFTLKSYLRLRDDIDIVHAHGGHCGFICNLQRIKPVVTTYHGSDINNRTMRLFSFFSSRMSVENIYISNKLRNKVFDINRGHIIPCGVNLKLFKPIHKFDACKQLGWKYNKCRVLFAGNFQRQVKNYPLAKKVIEKFNSDFNENIELMELKGYTRQEVPIVLSAVDALLLTSFSEGSPQIIKEAMACNCPIIAVNVGDVEDRLENVEQTVVTTHNVNLLTENLFHILSNKKCSNGREKLIAQQLDSVNVANKIYNIYKMCKNGTK